MARRKRAFGQPDQPDWTRYRPRGNRTLLAIIIAVFAAWIAFLAWMAM
jgi:hypothetical protein